MRSSPRRWLEDPGLSPIERAVLDEGRMSAIDYDVDAGLERFRTNLAALAAAGATTAVATAAKGATGALQQTVVLTKLGVKLLLIVGVPAAGVATAIHYSGGTTESADVVAVAAQSAPAVKPAQRLSAASGPAFASSAEPTAAGAEAPARLRAGDPAAAPSPALPKEAVRAGASSARASPALRTVRPEQIELEEERDDTAATATEKAEGAPAEPVPRRAAPKPVTAPSSTSAVPKGEPRVQSSEAIAEMQAIARARSLVGSNPGAAVAALEAIAKTHPRGYFVEERRALTVLALARAGNSGAARAHAAAFLRAYPKSPFADRVRAAGGL